MTKTYTERPSDIEYLGEYDGKNIITLRKNVTQTGEGWTCEEVTILTDYTPSEVVEHLDELFEQGAQVPEYMPVQPLADDDDDDGDGDDDGGDDGDDDNPDVEPGPVEEPSTVGTHSVIRAVFEDNTMYNTVTDDVWQWDFGQTLQIEGLNLPEGTAVDFSANPVHGVSQTRYGTLQDNALLVEIPDIMFGMRKYTDYNVYAYVFESDDVSGETTHRIKIPVLARPERSSDTSGGDTGGSGGGGSSTSSGRMYYGTCSTAGEVVAKTVACEGFVLEVGAQIVVKWLVSNVASSPTMNVNGTGPVSIYYRDSSINPEYLLEGRSYLFVYDGNAYQLVGDIDTSGQITYDEETEMIIFQ